MNNGTPVSFDGNSLQTDKIITNDIDHFSGPTKNMPMYGIGHANYSAIPFQSWTSKVITLRGTLRGDSIADLDQLIDTFKTYFINKDRNLDIGYNNGTRRYICTPETAQITRPGGLVVASFIQAFDCTYPFGQDITTSTVLDETGRTLAIYADSVIFGGSAPFQQPVFVITLNSVTDGTNAAINISNNANGQQLTITRTWTAGDVIEISSQSRTVNVNGSQVDFTGAFPEFPPGLQYIGYSDGFSARNFDINVSHYPLWA